MRTRKLVGPTVLAVALVATCIIRQHSHPPIALQVMSIRRGEILNDAGQESQLITLVVSNVSPESLYFGDHWIMAKAGIAGRWVETQNRINLVSFKLAAEASSC